MTVGAAALRDGDDASMLACAGETRYEIKAMRGEQHNLNGANRMLLYCATRSRRYYNYALKPWPNHGATMLLLC